jgi:hypothetical protein
LETEKRRKKSMRQQPENDKKMSAKTWNAQAKS